MLCKLERVLFVIVLGDVWGGVCCVDFFYSADRQTNRQAIYIYIKDVVLFYSAWNKKITAADLVPSHVEELTSPAIINYLGLFNFLRLSWGAWHLRGFNYILLQGLKRFLKVFNDPTLRIIN